jgi:hypothetical protein
MLIVTSPTNSWESAVPDLRLCGHGDARFGDKDPMSGRAALVLAAALLVEGCTVYGTELRSVPALGADAVVVRVCPKQPGLTTWPPSGGRLCFSTHGVDTEVEADNSETTFLAVGPLLPLVPLFQKRVGRSRPLEIELGFKTDQPLTFDPWQVSLRTDRGEAIRITRVETNVRDAKGVHTVEMDPSDAGLRRLSGRFVLTFERHVGPDQELVLALSLIGPDGSDVPLPPIRFKQGKMSYLGSVP